jgi:serine/threonine protein kinase
MIEKSHEIAGHQVLRQIGFDGAGGFGLGCLYEAVDRAGHHVALKTASVNALTQVVVKAHYQHPNLTQLFGYWVVDGNGRVIEEGPDGATQYTSREAYLAIATNLPEGNPILENCRDRRKRVSSTVSLPELLHHMDSIANGIDFLNSPKYIDNIGVVALHSFDVSPWDIRVTQDRALFDDIDAGVYSTVREEIALGTIMGRPRYMAPERLKGMSRPQSVLYSFAVTYHEFRTGTLPYANIPDNMADLFQARMANRLDLSRLSGAERPVIQKALSPDPDRRYDSCVELVQNLRSAVQHRQWWQFWS